MLTDYHMHLQPDGTGPRAEAAPRWDAEGGHLSRGWIGRYVARARARAVDEIAMTEHVYRFAEARPWLPGNRFWQAESTADVDAYCEAILGAREDGLPGLLGLEMDWLADRRDEIAAFLEGRPFDVVLGSVHFLHGRAIDDPTDPEPERVPVDRLWTDYLEQLVAAARTGLYDVMSHPDLPKVFGRRLPAALDGLLDDAVAAIADTGVAVECSSAGLRKPVRELYPEPSLLARFRRAGVPVTLSSDAHSPEDVGRDFPTAVAALRGAGYTTITRFRQREPRQVALRWG